VQCRNNKVALGGGALPSGSAETAVLSASSPAFTGSRLSGWSVKFNNPAPGARATIWVACATAG
jgi:hypothetical protein